MRPGRRSVRPRCTPWIRTIVSPYEDRGFDGRDRVVVTGPDIAVSAQSVTGIALLLHEFATNAARGGALSTGGGAVAIRCEDAGSEFLLTWTESGGPPVDRQADGEGFGSVLTRTTVKAQLGGTISRDWAPEGLTIRLAVARDRLTG